MASELLLVGGDSEAFNRYLKDDPCLGQHFSSTDSVCAECVAPVIVRGQLHLMKDVCRARLSGSDTPEDLVRLTSQDVLAMLQRGDSVEDIFACILNGARIEDHASMARKVLNARLRYLERTYDVPVPNLPTVEELKDHVSSTPDH